ncbi:TPA: LysE family transporter [Candidatus Woesearchaeota archaeon]|nr:LysE family transporter [Candidatus Woesearchaeota archaeon]
MNNSFKIFKNGLLTGLFLQLAIGPVFFFIINLALQRTIWDGLIAVLAVTLVDYFYITLSIVGIGKLLEKKKTKNVFGIISSLVLIIFGAVIIKGMVNSGLSATADINSINLLSSFLSVFIFAISNPMTIAWFTGIFTAKAVEYNYKKRGLYLFGFSFGLSTLIFMGTSVILFSLLKETVPIILVQILNLIVGFVLVGYGIISIIKILKQKN